MSGPVSKYGFRLFRRADFDELLEEAQNTQDYEEVYAQGHITLWRKKSAPEAASSSGIKRHKYSGKVPFSAEVFYSTCQDYTRQAQWDKRHGETKHLGELYFEGEDRDKEPKNSISWYYKRSPFPLANREFLSYAATIQDKVDGFDRWMTLVKSFEHPNFPPEPKNVRADIIYFGMIYNQSRTNPNECIYTIVTELDFKGWVPVAVLNWVIRYVPEEFEKNANVGCKMTVEMRAASCSLDNKTGKVDDNKQQEDETPQLASLQH